MNNLERKKLKYIYPDNELFHIYISNKSFVFRNISKKEFADVQSVVISELELHETICQMALIEPIDYKFSEGLAGIPDTIYPIIIQHSDFGGEYVIQRYLKQKIELSKFDEQAMAMVKAAMPEYTYEIMDSWPVSKLVKEATRAEYILKEIKGYNIEWKMQNDEEITEENIEENTLSDREIFREMCYELIEQGIDPIMHLWPLIDPGEREVERPLIGGYHWRNEEIMNAIRTQIIKYQKK